MNILDGRSGGLDFHLISISLSLPHPNLYLEIPQVTQNYYLQHGWKSKYHQMKSTIYEGKILKRKEDALH